MLRGCFGINFLNVGFALYSLQNGAYQFFDTRFIISVRRFDLTLCDDAADGHGAVTHMERETGYTGTFHLIVGDTLSFIAESGDLLVDVGYGETDTQHAALRSVETIGGYGATAHHIILGDTVHQVRISGYYIGHSGFGGIASKLYKRLLKTEVSNLVAVLIESQHAVEADGLLRNEEGTQRDVLLHTSTRTDTDDVEATFLCFLRAGLEIDVREGVNLIHDDVAVVGTDTRRDTGDTFAVELTGNGVELAALYVAFYTAFVEEGGYHIYSVLVTDQDHFVCQKLRFQMQMKCRTIGIDD